MLTDRYLRGFLQLFYPDLCAGCDRGLTAGETVFCLHCLRTLVPVSAAGLDPMQRLFEPRMGFRFAEAMYFYGKGQIIQRALHAVKYGRRRKLAIALGEMLGDYLADRQDLSCADGLVPVPLHPARQAQRGFNQAAAICEGMANVYPLPVYRDAVIRLRSTESQTHHDRLGRWENIEEAFRVPHPEHWTDRHLVVVDDVVTTGATLVACAGKLQREAGAVVSLASVAVSAEI